MAVWLTLLKAPTLQKLLLLVTLVTLTGLGFPPSLVEADLKHFVQEDRHDPKIKCYCENQGKSIFTPVSCQDNDPVDCEPKYKGCHVVKAEGGVVIRGCDKNGYFDFSELLFNCMRKKLPGESDNCVKGTAREIDVAFLKCQKSGQSEDTGGPISSSTARGGGDEVLEICTCNTDLCNGNGETKTISKYGFGWWQKESNAVKVGFIVGIATIVASIRTFALMY